MSIGALFNPNSLETEVGGSWEFQAKQCCAVRPCFKTNKTKQKIGRKRKKRKEKKGLYVWFFELLGF